ncbi:MAG: HD-GYP domain-containing protein, partial [Gammaproteobacteria bacterium]
MYKEAPADNTKACGQLRLGEIIGALSYALDLTEGQPPGHCLRCCWIGFHMGRKLGLDDEELWDLYYTLLLKDAGCSSNAERLCQLYGNDDRDTKHDFARVDTDSLEQLARFVFRHAAPGRGLSKRMRHLLNLMRNGERLAGELVATRCERGASIALSLGFDPRVADGVRSLDEHWDGHGHPQRLSGQAIPLGSRIALLAQVADVFHEVGGASAARAEVKRRSGSWFDPELAAVFESVSRSPGFWETLSSPNLPQFVEKLEPSAHAITVDEDHLDDIALAFAQVVDAKSHFTYGHSERVGDYAEAISAQLGLDPAKQRWVRRGGLLHDLGKLGVSNAVLDKPGPLDAEEWIQMKRHPGLSEEILARIGPYQELARVAGAHHERLDGNGYPRGLKGAEISLETRIITTADIFDALTA